MPAVYINPVCYNGSSKPNRDSVNFGPVSLGTVKKDYTTLTGNNWRAGINPSTNTVIYTDTYSRGVDPQISAVPSIHWISGQSQANILELISRLPERSANNYELFADYATAIAWLIGNGNYMLVNARYPEYLLDTECAINLELGFLASYPGTDTYVYDLISGGSQNIFSATNGAFTAPAAGSFVGYFSSVNNGSLRLASFKNAAGSPFNESLAVEGVFYQDGAGGGNYLVGTHSDSISIIVNGGNVIINSGAIMLSWAGVLGTTGIFHIVAQIPTGTEDPNQATLWINGVDQGMPTVGGSGALASRSIPNLTLCESVASPTHATPTRVYGFKAYGYNDQQSANSAINGISNSNYTAISAVYGI